MSHSPEQVFSDLINNTASLQIASITIDGLANIGYAPFINDNEGNFYIFVSHLASHTQDLINSNQVAILLTEDEQDTKQIFARTRATYSCSVSQVSSSDPLFNERLDQFEGNFGSVIPLLRGLPDFILFRLSPTSGRFVMGFGQAYDLGGAALQDLAHVKPNSS